MSAQVKKAGRIGTKIVAAILFVFLVMFNVQIGLHDGESSDISLFGLNLSVFVPNAIASGETSCYPAYRWSLFSRVNFCGTCDKVWGKYQGEMGICYK